MATAQHITSLPTETGTARRTSSSRGTTARSARSIDDLPTTAAGKTDKAGVREYALTELQTRPVRPVPTVPGHPPEGSA